MNSSYFSLFSLIYRTTPSLFHSGLFKSHSHDFNVYFSTPPSTPPFDSNNQILFVFHIKLLSAMEEPAAASIATGGALRSSRRIAERASIGIEATAVEKVTCDTASEETLDSSFDLNQYMK